MKRIIHTISLGVVFVCLISCNHTKTAPEGADDSTAVAVANVVQNEVPEESLTVSDINTNDDNIFTVVYAISDDGFVNVRETPSAKAAILDTLWMAFHGLGNGVLVEGQEGWSKVSVGEHVGWVRREQFLPTTSLSTMATTTFLQVMTISSLNLRMLR